MLEKSRSRVVWLMDSIITRRSFIGRLRHSTLVHVGHMATNGVVVANEEELSEGIHTQTHIQNGFLLRNPALNSGAGRGG